jgi:hypothetical protein
MVHEMFRETDPHSTSLERTLLWPFRKLYGHLGHGCNNSSRCITSIAVWVWCLLAQSIEFSAILASIWISTRLLDRGGALLEWDGIAVTLQLPQAQQQSEVVERLSHIWVVRAQRLLSDGERSLIGLLCLSKLALSL